MPTDPPTLPPSEESRPLAAVGWAVFLGMSWTWCIGMFLPVLLVREMGFWGWVAFAAPNVVGAGAMGWVLRNAAASRRVVDAHAAAGAAFSAVTIVFQISFAGWIAAALIGHWAGVLLLGVTAVTVLARRWGGRGEMLLAGVIFAGSVAAFAAAVWFGRKLWGAGFPPPNGPVPVELFFLAPVCVLGFLLCPYLDLTFHQARQATSPRAGVAAFALGFGGPFLLMIVFSLWYARLLAPLAAGDRADYLPPAVRWAVGGHMAVQLGYTIGVHWNALGWRPPFTDARKVAGGLLGFFAALFPQAAGILVSRLMNTGLSHGEIVYRLFLSFYGLVFPAYLWVCMVPTRDGAGLTNRKVGVFAAAVFVAAPMFFLGFIQRQMVWLVPGVAVVLLSRLLLVRTRGPLPVLDISENG